MQTKIKDAIVHAEFLMGEFIKDNSSKPLFTRDTSDAQKMAFLLFHLKEVIETLGDEAEWHNFDSEKYEY
mgnify:CR=1 FL=1|tara:strand:- start:276 stop:485 length:210 start_codon:yes stop_codon:yes gene_type:complete